MAKYRVNAGVHYHAGQFYKTGDVLDSIHDPRLTWPGKFSLVNPNDPATTPDPNKAVLPPTKALTPEALAAAQTAPPVKPDAPGAKLGTPKGKEKTAEFPKAEEEDCRVYKQGGLYYVYDADDLSKAVNAEGVNKTEVDGVIDNYLAE